VIGEGIQSHSGRGDTAGGDEDLKNDGLNAYELAPNSPPDVTHHVSQH
jgi:hypothetical protein